MAKVYANADGGIAGAVADDATGPMAAIPALAVGEPITFDDISNPDLFRQVLDYRFEFSIVNGELYRNGVKVTLAANSPEAVTRSAFRSQAGAILTALRAGTVTSNQIQRVLAYLLAQELKQRLA